MNRFRLAAVCVTLLVLRQTGAAESDEWPQFRGLHAGVAADDPALPDTWSQTENIAWKLDVPGIGWSSPVVWGDHVFVTSVISDGPSEEPPSPGLYSDGERPASTAPHRWMVYDVDFATGKIRWEREVQQRAVPAGPKHLKNSYASETPVTDGERVYVYFGNVGLFVFDLNGKPVWSKPIGAGQDALQAGARPRRRSLHGDRVYIVNDNDDAVVPRGVRQAHRRGDLARRTATKAPTGRRRSSGSTSGAPKSSPPGPRQGALLRSRRRAAVGAEGDVVDQHSDAVRPARAALHHVRLPRRRAAAGVRDPARRVAATSRSSPSETSNDFIAWSKPQLGRPTTRRRSSTATTTTRCSTAASSRATTPGPARRSTAGSASRRRERLHRVAVGVQRQDLRDERRRRHLRHPGRARVQGARQELPRRDDAGHAGHRARQPDHPDDVEALSGGEDAG